MSEMNRRNVIQAGIASVASLGLLNGCKVVEAGANIGMQAAGLSSEQADSVIRGGKAIAKTFEDFTPEQEYYIGRSVSATILSKYKLLDKPAHTKYLNLIGIHLAQSSAMPETFGGYHFAVLDSDSVNAFAAPGGFVYVTNGMLKCCPSEDSLAAVIAHEISHVQLKHGLQAIKSSRITDALAIIATEAASTLSGAQLQDLVNLFTGTITDITSTMINNGYSRSAEFDADKMALTIMGQAGYLNRGMGDMLTTMGEKLKPGGSDFFKTHPSPKNRLEKLSASIDKSVQVPAFRTQRLRTSLGQT